MCTNVKIISEQIGVRYQLLDITLKNNNLTTEQPGTAKLNRLIKRQFLSAWENASKFSTLEHLNSIALLSHVISCVVSVRTYSIQLTSLHE